MLTLDDVAKMPREKRLGRLGRAADILVTAVAGESDAALSRRPDAKNWAPKEVLCHLRDIEESFMGRLQAVMAMDDPKLLPADPDRWAEERQYLRNDATEALRAFRRRREETLGVLHGLTPEQWRRGGIHPARGRMTVDDIVMLMTWHDENHLEQLRRALKGQA
jgi:uncharacterized damage-inducible protein DinB